MIVPRFLIMNDVMQKCNYILIVAFVMLVLGSCIYIFFREEVIFTSWIPDSWMAVLPNYGDKIDSESLVGHIFLYSLADALWYGSLLLVESQLRSGVWYSKVITVATMALPFVLELLQWAGVIAGTFDWIDIIIYLLTLITFLLCSRNFYFKH